MSFLFIIILPYCLVLSLLSVISNPNSWVKKIRGSIIIFVLFTFLDLYVLKMTFNISSTFVDNNLNPNFLSLKSILLSNSVALIFGIFMNFIISNVKFIVRKESNYEKEK